MFLQAGMQKEIFHKLVSKLEQHCNNILIGCEIDYRRFIAQRSVNQVRCLVLFLPSSVFIYVQILHKFNFKIQRKKSSCAKNFDLTW